MINLLITLVLLSTSFEKEMFPYIVGVEKFFNVDGTQNVAVTDSFCRYLKKRNIFAGVIRQPFEIRIVDLIIEGELPLKINLLTRNVVPVGEYSTNSFKEIVNAIVRDSIKIKEHVEREVFGLQSLPFLEKPPFISDVDVFEVMPDLQKMISKRVSFNVKISDFDPPQDVFLNIRRKGGKEFYVFPMHLHSCFQDSLVKVYTFRKRIRPRTLKEFEYYIETTDLHGNVSETEIFDTKVKPDWVYSTKRAEVYFDRIFSVVWLELVLIMAFLAL